MERYRAIDELQIHRLTFDTMKAGVSHLSPDGRFLWVNRYYHEACGYTFEEMQRLHVSDITHPDDVELQVQMMERVRSGKVESVQMDRRCRRKDGSYFWASVNMRLFRGEDGKPLFFVNFIQDIRERKSAELRSTESQSRLELALALAKVGSWELDLLTNQFKWSQEVYSMFGRDPGLKPCTFPELRGMVHPDDMQKFKIGAKANFTSEEAQSMLYRIIRPSDGAVRTLRTVARHSPDPDGGPGRLLGALQDMTEWVEHQEARKQSEELLRLVLDTVPARIGYVTRDLRYRFVNRGYEVQLGMGRDQIVGKTVLEIQGERVFNAFKSCYDQVLAGQIVEIEKEGWGSDGKRRDLCATFSPDFGLNREVMGFVTLIQDVTEEREKERMILEQRQRLISAAKLAALGEMAGGISHEINNPLAVIHARAESLKEMALRGNIDISKVAYSAEKIELTAKRIAKIVKALRNIAREGEKDPFSSAPVRTIIEDAVEICRERFHHHAIHFEITEISSDLGIECRSVQISQVVLNLLTNAFDAAKGAQKRWVKLDAKNLGGRVEISVADSGTGVMPEIRDKIFQPFFTTKEPGEGTGLGLSVSKAIIDDHHGTIQIDEKSSHTRIVVTLPIKQPTA